MKKALENLHSERIQLKQRTNTTFNNMNIIIEESRRTADIAHCSNEILNNLDSEFERQTGLKGKDISFLFLAIALQCSRIFLMNNLTKIEKAGRGNHNEEFLHNIQNKLLKNFKGEQTLCSHPYYAPLNHIITTRGVPYDSTAYAIENYKLFKGANHRFATLGHDPILGLIFGTTNILTNTITGIKTPIITTNHVVYDAWQKNPRIGSFASTTIALKNAAERINGDITSVIAAIIKQILHIGTDMYTPCGIQIPGANLALTNANTEMLTKYISTGDVIKIGVSTQFSILINTLISTLHMLTYDEHTCTSRDVYSVKTRKIIMYSNLIASTSNIIWVSVNMAVGNEESIRTLDIGGLIITIHRILTDSKFIEQIKQEFVFGSFNKLIQGETLPIKVSDE